MGYARQVEAGIERVKATLPRLGELAIGGTAVGTGLNAPDGFGTKVVEVLVAQTGLAELTTARNFSRPKPPATGCSRRPAH